MTPVLLTDGRESVYLHATPDVSRGRLRVRLETGAEVSTVAAIDPGKGWRVESLPALRRQGAAVLLSVHDAPPTSAAPAKVSRNRRRAPR